MTTYIFAEAALVLFGYIFLLMQFRAGSKKHSASITEIFESGKPLQMLITQYWNILLALLCCILFLADKSTTNTGFRQGSMLLPISICLVALFVSMTLKLPVSIRNNTITSNELRYYVFIRSSYLVFYEWFFRGLLLNLSLEYFSVEIAVCINILLYTLAHSYSPKRELLACLPLGFIFCWLRIEFGSVLFPVILHLCMAIPFEIRILRSTSIHLKNLEQ